MTAESSLVPEPTGRRYLVSRNKRPVDPGTGEPLAGWTVPSAWLTFSAAQNAASRLPAEVSVALGTAADGSTLAGIDIDGGAAPIDNEGRPAEWVIELAAGLPVLRSEISRSRKGIHLYLLCWPGPTGRVQFTCSAGVQHEIEVYNAGRHFVLGATLDLKGLPPDVEADRAHLERFSSAKQVGATETPPPTNGNTNAWANAALREELGQIVSARLGERNDALNRASFSLGQIVGGDHLEREQVESQLFDSATLAGLPEKEARATIKSGLDAGAREQRHPVNHSSENRRIQGECAVRDASDREAVRSLRQPQPVMRCLADIQPERVEWLWPGRIPLGKLTLFAGHPGQGKSCLTLAIAAAVTRGAAWPLGEGTAPQGSVVVLSAEDGAGDTIRPRLDAAGGDPSRVTLLEAMRENGCERGVDLGRDIEALAGLLTELGEVRLVVVDPISAYLGKTDDCSNAGMRGLLSPLSRLAETHGCAVLLVSHLRKSATEAALLRAIGSVGMIAACRAAWGVLEDPDTKDGRLLLPLKSNLAAAAPGIRFGLTEQLGHEVPTIAWRELVHDADVNKLMGSDPDRGERAKRESPALDEALDWLTGELVDRAVPAADLKKKARKDGLSWATIRRAKDSLGVEATREGFGADGRWQWGLPTHKDVQELLTYGADEHLWGNTPEATVSGATNKDAHLPDTTKGDEQLWLDIPDLESPD